MFVLSAALMLGMQTVSEPPPVLLKIDEHCGMVADGKPIPVGELKSHVDQWVRDGREFELQFTDGVTEACYSDINARLYAAHVRRLTLLDSEAAPEKPE